MHVLAEDIGAVDFGEGEDVDEDEGEVLDGDRTNGDARPPAPLLLHAAGLTCWTTTPPSVARPIACREVNS